jgi:hypothetical protein
MRKKTFLTMLVLSITFVACQKQQTDEERRAEVDRQVQERLAAERQQQQAQELAQREASVRAREQALKERATAPSATPEMTSAVENTSAPTTNEGENSYSTFYTKLEPYGDWIETDDYGYVYHPREAENNRWRPYTNGRWVYTDAGWTWVSEEPFGWATYHYGRWTRLRGLGWVWVPGNEWAPAWVSWRKGDQYVGWAPLPPEAQFDRATGIHNWSDNYYDIGPDQYCFVPTIDFGEERVERAVVPAQQNVTIVNQTTNVTNITYNNTVIVSQGPSYDELRAKSRFPIQRLRLQREAIVPAQNARAMVRGEVVAIPAPVIAPARTTDRPRAVRQTIKQVEVDRGWNAISNRGEAQQARTKMKSEAAPPPGAPLRKFVKPAMAPNATAPSPAKATAATPPVPTTPIVTAPPRSAQTPAMPPRPATTRSPLPRTPSRPVAAATAVVTAPPVTSPPRNFARPAVTESPAPPPPQSSNPALPTSATPAASQMQSPATNRRPGENRKPAPRRERPGTTASPSPAP